MTKTIKTNTHRILSLLLSLVLMLSLLPTAALAEEAAAVTADVTITNDNVYDDNPQGYFVESKQESIDLNQTLNLTALVINDASIDTFKFAQDEAGHTFSFPTLIIQGDATVVGGAANLRIIDILSYGEISGGKFDPLTVNPATSELLNDISFEVTNRGGGVISGGTFNENNTYSLTVDNQGSITGGTFYGTVTNTGTISDGTFNGLVINKGTITGGTFGGILNMGGTVPANVQGTVAQGGELAITKQNLGTGSITVKQKGIDIPSGKAGETYNVAASGGTLVGLYMLTEGETVPTGNYAIESDFRAVLGGLGGYDFTMPNEAVTIVAVFDDYDPANYCTVILLPNGGTGTPTSVTVEEGSEYTLPGNSFTAPDGYTFAGWAYTADGEVITDTSITVSEDTDLYAVWENIPATHSHPVCGATHSDIGDHSGSCESISWTAWDGSDKDTETEGLQLTAGSYYLTEDITVSDAVITRGAVSLCLNGHSITLAEAAQNSVLIVGDEGDGSDATLDELNLCDCNGSNGSHTITDPTDADSAQLNISGGLITGGSGKPSTTSGSVSSYGGGVYTQLGAGFNMYGGTIAGNTGGDNWYLQGGGVYVSNSNSRDESFNLYGGAIINNDATKTYGGGVHVHYSGFNMYGGTIADNTSGDGGGGVYVGHGSKFNITGGKISGNAAAQVYSSNTGGGVYFEGSSFKLSGAPQITGNTSGTSKYGNTPRTDNVYLADGRFITVNGAMTDGASVGISMEAPGIFAEPDGTTVTDLTDYIAYFSDDDTTGDYGIDTDTGGNLVLSEATYPIYIGGIGLNDGEYLASRGTEAVTTKPEGGYAHYSNGVLTLSDFSLEGNYYSGVVHEGSLTVKLIGDSGLYFGGCSFDLRAEDGSAGALEFVNADTNYGYSTLNVNSTMLVYHDYDNSIDPGSITVGENAFVYSTGGVHATDLTVEGFLQSNDQIVLSGKLTRKGYGEIFAYSSTIEWSCGADEPVNFDSANYFDLGDGGVAVDENEITLVPGYYFNSAVGEYRLTFFYESDEWTQANAVDSVYLLLGDPFAAADIYVGGVGLSDGEYLANGAAAATTTAPASGGYAYYENGVLTLSDFSYEGKDYVGVEHLGSLTVKLLGVNKLTFEPSDNDYCFYLYEDGSGTPDIEFISGDSGGGTLEICAYELVDNDSYDEYYSNVTIGENATVIADAHLDVNQLTINGTLKVYVESIAKQLTVNGTLELYHWTGLEGKLIRGENGTVRAEYDGKYGVIEWIFDGDEPSSFDPTNYLELNGGEAVDKDGNALVLGYYFDDEYYVTFFDAELSEADWSLENAEKSVILQSKADAGTTDPPVVDPPVTYAVTVQDSENGTVTASSATASEGDTVTLTVAPAEGYELYTLTVGGADVTAQVSNGTYSFTMPNEAVTIVAVFSDYGSVPPTQSSDLIITGGTAGTDYTYENGVLDITAAGTYEIKNADPATATGDIIKVSAPEGSTVNITLSGVNIDVSNTGDNSSGNYGLCAFDIGANCTTNIILKDKTTNILKSGAYKAGLQNKTYPLTISCEHSKEENHECDSDCGAIEAYGGKTAAGIGGGEGGNGSNITISGGTVTAESYRGAGIGGGTSGIGSNITISGGTVTAESYRGAGIGGGTSGIGSNITISGGIVTATSERGAGIGGGNRGNGSNIKIAPAENTEIEVNTGATASEAEELTYAFAKETDITELVSGNAYFHSETTEHSHSGGTATCTEKAVCEFCAQPYGNTLGHDWGNWLSNGDGTHTRTCANDASHTETNDCSGGTATCTEKAKCTACGTAYGELAGHSFSDDWTYDENNHWHAATCGHEVVSDMAEHSYGNDRTCDLCGYRKPAPYIPSDPTYRPVVDCGENGDVTVTPKNPEKGDTVIITPNPDTGYEVDEVIVTDRNGDPVTVTDKGDGTYRFKQPTGKVTITVTFAEIDVTCPGDKTCPMYGYTDLDMTAWYHDGVHFCIENDLMNGTGDTVFSPNGTLTRAMLVTILWRMEGEPVVNYLMWFEDVPADTWYTEAVRWAASENIVEGYYGRFSPDDPITREQLATILWRYAQHKGYDVSVGEDTNILSFEDAFDISEYAIPAMQWACGAGIIGGMNSGGGGMLLDPLGSATRAEAATMLTRFSELDN